MKISYEDLDRTSIVTLSGEFAAESVDNFRRGVSERLERGARDFVLCVNDMVFIDSGGLEAFLWLQEQAAERHGRVRVICDQPAVLKIFEITRLAPEFEFSESVIEAMRALR